MSRVRVTVKQGGRWPEKTETIRLTNHACPVPLMQSLRVLEGYSKAIGDDKFRSISEVVNEALTLGVEQLKKGYEKHPGVKALGRKRK